MCLFGGSNIVLGGNREMTILPSTTWHLTGKLTENGSQWRFCENVERGWLFCATFCLGPVFAILWNVKDHFCNLPKKKSNMDGRGK